MNIRSGLAAMFLSCAAGAQVNQLPQLKKDDPNAAPLGDGPAVQEVKKYLEKKDQPPAPVAQPAAPVAQPAAPVKEASPLPVKIPSSRFDEMFHRTFVGVQAEGFFPRGSLKQEVGSGWGLGAFAFTNLTEFLQPEISIDWLFASDTSTTQENSLHLIPITVGLRFKREFWMLRGVVEPVMGGAFWWSNARRLLDGQTNGSHGFDFVAALGASLEYEWRENSLFGLKVRYQYGGGLIDQAFWTLGLAWSKRIN